MWVLGALESQDSKNNIDGIDPHKVKWLSPKRYFTLGGVVNDSLTL